MSLGRIRWRMRRTANTSERILAMKGWRSRVPVSLACPACRTGSQRVRAKDVEGRVPSAPSAPRTFPATAETRSDPPAPAAHGSCGLLWAVVVLLLSLATLHTLRARG